MKKETRLGKGSFQSIFSFFPVQRRMCDHDLNIFMVLDVVRKREKMDVDVESDGDDG